MSGGEKQGDATVSLHWLQMDTACSKSEGETIHTSSEATASYRQCDARALGLGSSKGHMLEPVSHEALAVGQHNQEVRRGKQLAVSGTKSALSIMYDTLQFVNTKASFICFFLSLFSKLEAI